MNFVQAEEQVRPLPLTFRSEAGVVAAADPNVLVSIERELTLARQAPTIVANIASRVEADDGTFGNVVSGLTLQALVGTRAEVRRFLETGRPEGATRRVSGLLDALGPAGALAFAAEELPLDPGERLVLDRIASGTSADVTGELARLPTATLGVVAAALGREDEADALLGARDDVVADLAGRLRVCEPTSVAETVGPELASALGPPRRG